MTLHWPLLETIRVEGREFRNLEAHEARMRSSRRTMFGIDEPVDLERTLEIPDDLGPERYKCRLLYGESIGPIEFSRYTVREVKSLRVVEIRSIDYSLKYADRSALEGAKALADRCDEVIVARDGLLTDTSYGNIALFDGDRWFTPDPPLLSGTRRSLLIARGAIIPARIAVADLDRYESVAIINAMLDLGEVVIPRSAIEV